MLYRFLLYFLILDRKMSFSSKPQVSSDRLFDGSRFPYWNQTHESIVTKKRRWWQTKKLYKMNSYVVLTSHRLLLVLCQCSYCTQTVVRGYNAPDILADKLDFNDNYRFSPGPVRHGDDILTPLAHWCGWDLKCSLNILMYVCQARSPMQGSPSTYQRDSSR